MGAAAEEEKKKQEGERVEIAGLEAENQGAGGRGGGGEAAEGGSVGWTYLRRKQAIGGTPVPGALLIDRHECRPAASPPKGGTPEQRPPRGIDTNVDPTRGGGSSSAGYFRFSGLRGSSSLMTKRPSLRMRRSSK